MKGGVGFILYHIKKVMGSRILTTKKICITLMENMSVALIGGGISYILLTPYSYISS